MMGQSLIASTVLFFSKNHECSGVVTNVLDFDILVCKFKLQSLYNVHFRINTLQKSMKPLIPQLWVE